VTAALCGNAQDLDSLLLFRMLQPFRAALCPSSASRWSSGSPRRGVSDGDRPLRAGAISAPALSPLFQRILYRGPRWRLVSNASIPVALLGIIAAMIVAAADVPHRTGPSTYRVHAGVSRGCRR